VRDAVVASKLEAKPVEWLWQNRIPKGMITVVAGKPDQGKGLFAVHVAADVSKRGGNVLYSAAEDDPARMTRPRLEAAGANLDRVLVWSFRLPAQMRQLEQRIKENDIRLVVMDPMASHLTGGIKRHSDNIRVVTDQLYEIGVATGCAFLVIEHALKRVTSSADPLSMIGGSGSGLPAAARAAYLFGKDPKDGDRRLLAPVKLNIAEWPKTLSYEVDTVELDSVSSVPFLVPQGETDATASSLLQKPNDRDPGRPPDKRAAASEWLAQYLFDQGKPVKAGLVIEDARQRGITTRTLKRAADDLSIVRKPPGGGRHCTWELPDHIKKAVARSRKESKKGGRK